MGWPAASALTVDGCRAVSSMAMAMAAALVMAAMAMTTAAVATVVVTTFVTVMAVQMGLEAALSADQLSALTGGTDSCHAVSMRKKRRP